MRLTQAAIEAGGEATEQTRDALTERSWKRKIAEAHLATLIEKTTSKEDILTGYLNVGYFGSGAYGVQSAARRYYSTDATKLTLSQAATLAGVLQSPVSLDPRQPGTNADSPSSSAERDGGPGMVTPAEAAAAQAEPITLSPSLPEQGCQVAGRDWGLVCDGALRELKESDWLGRRPEPAARRWSDGSTRG